MEKILRIVKKCIPKKLFRALQPGYHSALASIAAFYYRYPSRNIYVVGVTGTKGKSTVTELIAAILEAAGHTVALSNTIRFKIAESSISNMYKMSMPGRFFMQQFLSRAVKEGCDFAVIEMTSEGAKLHRHKHIYMDAFVFTNLSPEHIESHGSFEAYRDAKLSLKNALITSPKPEKKIIANKDDSHGALFLDAPDTVQVFPYSLRQAEPHVENERGVLLTYEGVSIHSPLIGLFNVYNILAAITFARAIDIPMDVIKRGIESVSTVRGRVQKIEEGQHFEVYVDYAHTPDSLEKLYSTFHNRRLICVLGNCGGGRDTWKRSEMAKIAEQYCETVVLTNEDPYDEDPHAIIQDMEQAMEKKPTIIMDRRKAIAHALKNAQKGDVVLITGKGTDPYMMVKNGNKIPWSDEKVAREELHTILNTQ